MGWGHITKVVMGWWWWYGVGGGRAAVKEVVVVETVEATAAISTTYQCGHKSSFES